MEALSKLKKGEGLTKLLTEEEIQEHIIIQDYPSLY
jgi:hypothetical protein